MIRLKNVYIVVIAGLLRKYICKGWQLHLLNPISQVQEKLVVSIGHL